MSKKLSDEEAIGMATWLRNTEKLLANARKAVLENDRERAKHELKTAQSHIKSLLNGLEA